MNYNTNSVDEKRHKADFFENQNENIYEKIFELIEIPLLVIKNIESKLIVDSYNPAFEYLFGIENDLSGALLSELNIAVCNGFAQEMVNNFNIAINSKKTVSFNIEINNSEGIVFIRVNIRRIDKSNNEDNFYLACYHIVDENYDDEVYKIKNEKQSNGDLVKERIRQLLHLNMKFSQKTKEQQAILEQLNQSEQLLRLALDNNPQRIFWKDTMLNFLGCNKAFAKDAGFDEPDEIIGKSDYMMPWSINASDYRADDRYVIENDKPKYNIIEQQVNSKGEVKWIRTSKVPLKNSAGHTIGILGYYDDITAQKAAEEKLLLANKELREKSYFIERVADTAPYLIYIYNLENGKNEYINNAVETILGYSKLSFSNINGKIQEELFHKDDLEDYARNILPKFKKMKDSEVIDRRFRMRNSKGEWRWIAAKESIFSRSESGAPLMIIGTGDDITERLLIEEKLKENQRINENLLTNIPGMAYRCKNDREWTMEYVSNGCFDLTGYYKDELQFNKLISYNSIIHPLDQVYVAVEVKHAIDHNRPFQLQYRIIHSSGEIKWVKEQGRGVFDDNGSLLFLEGLIIDQTEEKHRQKALFESEQRFRALFENSSVPMSQTSLNGEIKPNEAYAQLLGYTIEELKNIKWSDLTYPEDLDISQKVAKDLLENKLKNSKIVKRYIHKSGKIIWTEMNTTLHRDNEGKPLYFITNLIDITAKVEAEKKLRESESLYRILSENTLDYLYIIDTNFNIKYVNTNSAKLLGYSKEELLGKNITELLGSLGFSSEYTSIKAALKSKETLTTEALLKLPQKNLYLHTYLIPQLNDNGDVDCIIGVSRDISELKEATEKIKLSEEKYRTLVDDAIIPIIQTDFSGRILYLNKAGLNLFEIQDKDSIINDNVLNYYKNPDDRNLFIARLKEIGYVDNFVADIINRNKREYTLLINAKLNDERIEGLLFDITIQKKIEAQLHETLNALNTFMNAIPESTLLVDKNARIIIGNEVVAQRMNKKRLEIIGMVLWDTVPYDKIEHRKAFFNQVLTEKRPVIYQDIRAGRNYEHFLYPVVDANGEVELVAILAFDITEKVMLQDVQKQLSAIIETSTDLIATIEGRRITYINKAGMELLGWSEDKNHDLSLNDMLSSDEISNLFKVIIPELLEKGNWTGEIEILSSTGKAIPVSLSCVLLTNDENHFKYSVICRDITKSKEDAKKINDTLIELQEIIKNRDLLFSIIAHDLKNPFTGLLGLSDSLLRSADILNPAEIKEFASNFNTLSKSIYSLLENLLTWANIQRNRIKLVPTQINVFLAFEHIISIFQSIISEKEISVKTESEDDIIVLVDSDMFFAIVRNLLSNALKFTRQKGSVTIKCTKQTDGYALFEIADSGIGIPDSFKDKILDSSYIYTTKGSNEEKGSGIGLVIVKNFIEMNNGRIWFDSVAGYGTTFYFTLPLAAENK
jgi:PAS domain S-box-containing protein